MERRLARSDRNRQSDKKYGNLTVLDNIIETIHDGESGNPDPPEPKKHLLRRQLHGGLHERSGNIRRCEYRRYER